MNTQSIGSQLLIMLAVLVLGLASRSSFAATLPDFVTLYVGDVLWTLLIFLGIRFFFVSLTLWQVTALALGFSFFIELTQLYQADWIRQLRATRLGALVLGHYFLWTDILSYTVGCAIGVIGVRAGSILYNSRGKQISSPK